MFCRSIISFALSFFLWSNSLWALSPDAELVSASDTEAIVKKISSKDYTFNDAITSFATFDKSKSIELKKYLEENHIYKRHKNN